jgi:heparan sulfate N-deacetylase/N-sulfotransferase NDST2
MDLFPKRNNRTNIKIFEKSATYFTSTIAQTRLKALLPKVQLVAVLLEPGERAYSWYQHQKAHGMQAATTYSFNEVLNAKSSNKEAYELQQVIQEYLN